MTSISGSSSLYTTLLQQAQQARFQKADNDGSGGLSLEEFAAAGPKDANGNAIQPPTGAPGVEDLFATLDTDGDGSLSQDEFNAGAEKKGGKPPQGLVGNGAAIQLLGQSGTDGLEAFFSAADQDGDGSLSQDEFTSAIEDLAQEIANAAGGSGPAAGGPPPGGPPPGGSPPGGGGAGGPAASSDESSTSQVYDALDTNKDGTVSLDELLAAGQSDDTDTSGDTASTDNLRNAFMNFLLSLQEDGQSQRAA